MTTPAAANDAAHRRPAGAGPSGVRRTWVSDTDSALGRRVVDRLEERPGDHLHDRRGLAGDLGGGPVVELIDSVADQGLVAVLLMAADTDRLSRHGRSLTVEVAAALEVIDATPSVDHVVLVSSAMVYGAWENNPVPLTEDAVVRPDPAFAFARQLAAIEAAVERWRDATPGRAVAVLRPVVAMAAGSTSGLAAALAAATGRRIAQDDPPAQFVHLDDLAAAIALAVRRRLDGVFNVAPDGSVPAARVRALSGGVWRVRLPDRWGDTVSAWRWRLLRGPVPPGVQRYARSTWLVSNDRLRAEGWRPTVTNEQVYVEGTEAPWWSMVTPKRRQEAALGGVVLLVVAAVAGGLWVVRRHRSRGVR
jgi:nucleoside-diphosphate-sugar epimerase